MAANKLIKPHPSPLPPPPQTFSDSPRKRRGRGYTNSNMNAMANSSGTYNRKNDGTNKLHAIQSKLSGISGTDNCTPCNFVNISHDNSSFTPPEGILSKNNQTSASSEDQLAVDAKKISDVSEKSNKLPSGAVSSIVSVETKQYGKKESGNLKLTSV